jgi:hypothetical protein
VHSKKEKEGERYSLLADLPSLFMHLSLIPIEIDKRLVKCIDRETNNRDVRR